MTTTSDAAQAVHKNVFVSTAEAEGIAEGIAAGAAVLDAPTPKRMDRAYEGFLGLPVWVILAMLWVAGATLLGSCALALYMVGSVLLRAVVGSL